VPARVVMQVHAVDVKEAAASLTSEVVPAIEASAAEPGVSVAVVPEFRVQDLGFRV
jgi:hypothetical protein